MNSHVNTDAIHEKVFTLLPWRINETLTAAEQSMVDAHIETCSTCKQEMSLLQTTFDAALIPPASIPNVHSSLTNSLHRIKSEAHTSAPHTCSFTDHLKNLLRGLQEQLDQLPVNCLAYAATGFSVTLVALFMLQQNPSATDDDFHVLSSPIVADDSTRLSINFTTAKSTAQAESVLRQTNPEVLASSELQGISGSQFILTLPASINIQQISDLVRDLEDLPEISRVDMQATN